MGIKLPNTKNGKLDNKSIENAKKVYDMLDASEKNLLNQLKTESGALDNSNPALLARLEQIRASKRQIEKLISGELGLDEPQNGIREFSDDEAANNETLEYLWYLSKGNMETYRQYVSNWLDESGVTPHFKEQYMKKFQETAK